jgi:hypothetical protein
MNSDKQTEHFQRQGKSQNDLLLEDESWSMTPFAPLLLLNHQAGLELTFSLYAAS